MKVNDIIFALCHCLIFRPFDFLTNCLITDAEEMVPVGSKDCLPSSKSEELVYHDALLPNEMHRAHHEKYKEIECHVQRLVAEWQEALRIDSNMVSSQGQTKRVICQVSCRWWIMIVHELP